MKKYIYIIAAVILLHGTLPQVLTGQRRADIPEVVINARVVDPTGQPVKDATIQVNDGAVVRYTDGNGNFVISGRSNSRILIEADGFRDTVIDLTSNADVSEIVLEPALIYADDKDQWERLDGGTTSKRYSTSAVGEVDMAKVARYPDLQLSNRLQGTAAGLIVRPGTSGLGNNVSEIFIRGQHAYADNTAKVIIDGIERPLDDIQSEEIESIHLLKDAAAKILYGPHAANGILMITTKRGQANKRTIRATAEFGIQPTMRNPEFLGSYDYATLYNEARANDGMSARYLPYQLESYKNSSGENDPLYPDVNWYDKFTRNMMNYRKAIIELNGGTNAVQYALVTGYTGSSGLEAVGKRTDLNRINIRGNLDIRITDYLAVVADVAARVEIRDWGGRANDSFYGDISTLRPNEYPLILSASDLGLEENKDGSPYYGGSTRKPDNLYVDMTSLGGRTSERYSNSQTNLGLKFDFDKYVKGLFLDAYLTFDNYNYLREKVTNSTPTYAIDTYLDEDGNIAKRITQVKNVNQNSDINIQDEVTTRTFGWRANVGYVRDFGLHGFSAILSGRYYRDEVKGQSADWITTNFTGRLNYSYDDRYLFELTLAGMGANKFQDGNKYHFSKVGSVGWIISSEEFMNSAKKIDFLKLKVSYGQIGYSGNTGHFLYRNGWSTSDGHKYYTEKESSFYYMDLTRIGNSKLKWETSTEFNVGLEGVFLNRRFAGEINYFREIRNDIIGVNSANYSSIIGDFLYYENMDKVLNRGVDAYANWSDRVNSDFRYSVGVNFTFSKNRLEKWNEASNIEDYRKAVGRPTSTIFGLQTLGLFGRDVDINSHAKQLFAYYTDGDLAYADLNNDGVVDDRDQTVLGKNFPSTVWGIDFDFNYKGFGLYILGTAETGVTRMLTNNYYWNTGENSYSVLALDRYHAVNNPTGSYPRLTTATGETNSYRNSSYWAEEASFFRLKNVELSYMFVNRTGTGIYKDLKIFARATNLLVISAIKDSDPERIDAGVVNYPNYRTISAGVTVTF